MNKELQAVTEFYNDKCIKYKGIQFEVLEFTKDYSNKLVRIREHGGGIWTHCIGFYEWLLNPKYKVFEVFGIFGLLTAFIEKWYHKSVQEIIEYLYNQIKEVK